MYFKSKHSIPFTFKAIIKSASNFVMVTILVFVFYILITKLIGHYKLKLYLHKIELMNLTSYNLFYKTI